MKFLKIVALLMVPLLLLTTIVVLATGAIPYKVYVINTGSMSPNIPPGSAVLVHEGHWRVGQVVTFVEDGLTVTHRLVSISPQGLTTTKGDGNVSVDPWHVPKSQIIGGVVVAPRYLGYWITYFRDPLGLASLVLVVLALWQIWSFTGEHTPEGARRDERTLRKKRRSLWRVLTFRRALPSTAPDVALASGDERVTLATAPVALTLPVSSVAPVDVVLVGAPENANESVPATAMEQRVPSALTYEDGFAALALEVNSPTKVSKVKLKEPRERVVPRVRNEGPLSKTQPAKLLRQYESAVPARSKVTARTPKPTPGKLLRQYESATPTTPGANSTPPSSPSKLLRQYEGSNSRTRDGVPPRKLPSVRLKARDRVG